ncbi:MAG: hypothetical protein ACK4UP_05500 [Spirosomataceae bacterium]
METYIKKLRHILPTFLTITFGTVFGLGFIRWIFSIQSSIIDINEDIWVLWLPLFLPWIPITLWLRQRICVLTVKKGDIYKIRFVFQFIAWVTISAMLLISQAYLTTATGKLKELSTIEEIEYVEKVRFYRLNDFTLAPSSRGSFTNFRTSGKYKQYLNFDIYFVIPILKDSSERIIYIPKYWYGVKFKKQISNNISDEKKEKMYQAFFMECINKMKKYDFHSLDYFERKPNSDDRQNFLIAIQSIIKWRADDRFIILEPIKEKFEERNGNKFAWTLGSFGIGLCVLLFFLLWPDYSETERELFLSKKSQS